MRAHSTAHPSRAARGLAGAALTVAVAGITSTAAVAAGTADIGISPGSARPGDTVTLTTRACGPGGSAGVDAGSLDGGIIGLEPEKAGSATARGTLRIPDDAGPGTYTVGGSCTDGSEVTGTIRVSEEPPRSGKDGPGAMPGGGKGAEPRKHEDRPAGPPEMSEHDGQGEDDGHARQRHEDGRWEDGGKDGRHDGRWDDRHHDGRWDDRQDDGRWEDRKDSHHRDGSGHHRGAMPHGRMHTGLGGGIEDVNSAQLAGGSAALATAAGGVFFLRRRHRAQRH
ncbi:hypothetical protein [Streptomyces sp. TR02-1]|uniref:hypothetical protein n=1 Tax=Streptomyces sp. TR02-1 TaxID=3385977 RepID=UPI0039A2E865